MTLCRDLGMVGRRPMLLLLSGAEINLSLLHVISVRTPRHLLINCLVLRSKNMLV